MKKTVILVADPETPCSVPGDGKHLSSGHAAYGNKSAILHVANPMKRGHPNAPLIVLKEGSHLIQQSTIGYLARLPHGAPAARRGKCGQFSFRFGVAGRGLSAALGQCSARAIICDLSVLP